SSVPLLPACLPLPRDPTTLLPSPSTRPHSPLASRRPSYSGSAAMTGGADDDKGYAGAPPVVADTGAYAPPGWRPPLPPPKVEAKRYLLISLFRLRQR
ncbi:unnamed protein product, partial [Urochloa humidicola]